MGFQDLTQSIDIRKECFHGFFQPASNTGLGDLLQVDHLPPDHGIYREDPLKLPRRRTRVRKKVEGLRNRVTLNRDLAISRQFVENKEDEEVMANYLRFISDCQIPEKLREIRRYIVERMGNLSWCMLFG